MTPNVASDDLSLLSEPSDRSLGDALQRWLRAVLPVGTILVAVIIGWYALALYFNLHFLNIQMQDIDPNGWHRLSLLQKMQRALSTSTPTMPTPVQTVGDFIQRLRDSSGADSGLWADLSYTGRAALLGFLVGTAIGVGLALVFMTSTLLTQALMPYVVASQTIPIVALVPPIMITLGLGLRSEVLISAYLAFFSITISTFKGLQSVQPVAFELMRSYAATRWQVFTKLRLPAALPFLFTGLRVGVTASLVGAIIAELPSGSPHGLGQGLVAASEYSQNIQLWSTMLGAALLGLILFEAVVLVERLVIRWRVEPSA